MAKPKKDTTKENAQSIQPKNSTTALKNLFISPRNVRTLQVVNSEADTQLKASILSVGLIHNLAVTKELVDGAETGRFAVEAGGRRLRALQALLNEGVISADYLVDINIFGDEQALDVSMMENIHKSDMHPYDEFMAYKAKIEAGSTIESVAEMNGVTVTHVKRRLRLANASPKVLEEYKTGTLDIEQLMTLCLSKDHNTQESVWFNAQSWNKSPRDLRRAIIQDEVPMNDKRVIFVGVDNYVARGGKLRTDLFSDGTGDTLLDIPLLDAMAQERLALEANLVEKEGWGWVEYALDMDWDYLHQFGREHKQTRDDLTEEEKAKEAELDAKLAELEAKEEAHDLATEEGSYDSEQMQEEAEKMLEAIRVSYEAEAEAFSNSLEEWENGIGELGIILMLDHKGNIERREGLVRGKKKSVGTQLADQDDNGEVENKGYSQSLKNELFAIRTEALQLEVAKHTNIAVALLAHKLVLNVMPHYGHSDKYKSKLTISYEKPKTQLAINNYDETLTSQFKNALFDKWLNILPATSDELLNWLLVADQSVVMELLGVCAGLSLSLLSEYDGEVYQNIANLVNLDASEYWQATPENFFNRISKADMSYILGANNKTLDQDSEKLKKKEMAKLVHEAITNDKWLPEQIKVKG